LFFCDFFNQFLHRFQLLPTDAHAHLLSFYIAAEHRYKTILN
jgi:hypothetical protein